METPFQSQVGITDNFRKGEENLKDGLEEQKFAILQQSSLLGFTLLDKVFFSINLLIFLSILHTTVPCIYREQQEEFCLKKLILRH